MDSVPLSGTAWRPQKFFEGPSPSPEGGQQFGPPCHKLGALQDQMWQGLDSRPAVLARRVIDEC